MSLFQAVWLYYLDNPALVINSLALFYALSGSWLVFAAQWRAERGRPQLAAGITGNLNGVSTPVYQRANRMFSRIGMGCLAVALLLSLLSTRV